MLRPAAAVVALALVSAPALALGRTSETSDRSAGPSAKTASKPRSKTKTAKANRASKAKHAASARAIRESMKVSLTHHFKVDNMPRGWQWPPSAAMGEQEKTCQAKLDALGIAWQPATREGHVVDPITVSDMTLGGVAFTGMWSKDKPQTMDCELALAFGNFAPALAQLGVREVRFGSIYRWTKVRAFGKTQDVLSRHALGLAMDVVSVIDADGGEHFVGRDYKSGDAVLLGVEQAVNASGLFRILLTPKNDPVSHKDHFHFEANPDFTPLPADEPPPGDPDRVDI
jgi:hypothetical protein